MLNILRMRKDDIIDIIKNTNEDNQDKVDVLKYFSVIRKMFNLLWI